MITSDSRSDPAKPKVVLARAATKEGGFVQLVLHPAALADVVRLKNGTSAKLGQYGGLVHGNIWASEPDAELRDEGTPGLMQPTAIFCGLKRPRSQRSDDDKTTVYILNPNRNYTWPFVNEFARGPVRAPVPPGAVFAVYVDYGADSVDALRNAVTYPAPRDAQGVIIDWEWVVASPHDPRLPANSDTRYAKKIWDEHDG